MTLSQQIREPEYDSSVAAASPALALRRAMSAAEDAPLLDHLPWRMHALEPEVAASVAWFAARKVEAEFGAEDARAAYEQWRSIPGWIVVTLDVNDDPVQAERDLEDCLTAVQRASLSLWSDNIPSNWVNDLLTDASTLVELMGEDPAKVRAVGILFFGHAERPASRT